MRKFCFTILIHCILNKCLSQDLSRVSGIDSITSSNNDKIETIFEKVEKNHLIYSHGRSPKYILSSYKFTVDNILVSKTQIRFSVGDTDLIINYYFNSNQLIKVKTIWYDKNNLPNEELYYYYGNKLIFESVKDIVIYYPSYYLQKGAEIIKQLKKKPIKFPK